VIAYVGADHQLEQDAAFQLLDRIDYLVANAGRGFPLGVNASGRRNLNPEICVSDFSFPSDGRAWIQKLACAQGVYARRLKSLGSLDYLEFDRLAFFKVPVSVALDGGEMHEDIVAVGTRDESITFFRAEPLNSSSGPGHMQFPPFWGASST
jgi:hypothetical protein